MVLERLIGAGLGSLPGGGAEILVDRVRHRIARLKSKSEQWLAVHRAAHRLGLPFKLHNDVRSAGNLARSAGTPGAASNPAGREPGIYGLHHVALPNKELSAFAQPTRPPGGTTSAVQALSRPVPRQRAPLAEFVGHPGARRSDESPSITGRRFRLRHVRRKRRLGRRHDLQNGWPRHRNCNPHRRLHPPGAATCATSPSSSSQTLLGNGTAFSDKALQSNLAAEQVSKSVMHLVTFPASRNLPLLGLALISEDLCSFLIFLSFSSSFKPFPHLAVLTDQRLGVFVPFPGLGNPEPGHRVQGRLSSPPRGPATSQPRSDCPAATSVDSPMSVLRLYSFGLASGFLAGGSSSFQSPCRTACRRSPR